MAHGIRKRVALAVAMTAIGMSLTASVAFAGEITGNGKTLEPLHANSICAYSGQNDDPTGIDPNNGPPGRVQSYGQVVQSVVRAGGQGILKGIPGTACRGGSL